MVKRNVKENEDVRRAYEATLKRQKELEDEVKSLKQALREAYIRHDIVADRLERADPKNAMRQITKGAPNEHIGDMSLYVIRHHIWYLTKVLDTEGERVQSYGADWQEKLQLLKQREQELSRL